MATASAEEGFLSVNYKDFVNNVLPLYSGPQVTIRVGSSTHKYKLPKALLCEQSPYFKAMFGGKFQEGEEQSTTLNEEDGVISTRSFEFLLQWLYLGRVIFGVLEAEEAISATIEFVRVADMFGVTRIEALMAERIKDIIMAEPRERKLYPQRNLNTAHLTAQHIVSAALLPKGHRVRSILASAAVAEFFQGDEDKFISKAKDIPEFAADLLGELKTALQSFKSLGGSSVTFTDPIDGAMLHLC